MEDEQTNGSDVSATNEDGAVDSGNNDEFGGDSGSDGDESQSSGSTHSGSSEDSEEEDSNSAGSASSHHAIPASASAPSVLRNTFLLPTAPPNVELDAIKEGKNEDSSKSNCSSVSDLSSADAKADAASIGTAEHIELSTAGLKFGGRDDEIGLNDDAFNKQNKDHKKQQLESVLIQIGAGVVKSEANNAAGTKQHNNVNNSSDSPRDISTGGAKMPNFSTASPKTVKSDVATAGVKKSDSERSNVNKVVIVVNKSAAKVNVTAAATVAGGKNRKPPVPPTK